MSSDRLRETLRRPGTVLLDGPRPDADSGRRGARVFCDPGRTLRAATYAEVVPLLKSIDVALAEGLHVAGFLSYEAGYALEPGRFPDPPAPAPGVPLAWFGVYGPPLEVSADAIDAALPTEPVHLDAPRLAVSEGDYLQSVARIRAHIRAGDVYQVNRTMPFRATTDADPLALYAALRRRQRVAYGAFVRLGGLAIASVSPELFFRVDGGVVTTRPMKGTAARGDTAAHDDALAEALAASPKDRAENLMVVDLLRNDVSRVAEPGTVRVPALFETERYETVTQMTSTVTARLRPGVGLAETMGALFPCGSVTGAPKIRAMSIIRQEEAGARGVYCGAIGFASPVPSGAASHGDEPPAGGGFEAAFSVPIRTAVIQGAEVRYDVGSGVVWDSDPAAEYAECLLKARVLNDLDDLEINSGVNKRRST